ncbi:HAD-IA family hydrolase [Bacillus testis]|uniref:HAD-IA family hydrolase n=1 Tax=Bacillus testis TaxID=1622072 RepID=UPI000AA4CDC2|nr:HAD-IA family hydrolase [Bacillus testis]
MKKLGIKDYFDFIVSRDDVEHVKPAPDLYNKSLEILGVSPDEAIIFEDSLNGLIAARAAGIACVIVPNPVTRALPFDGHFLKLDSMAAMPLAEVVKRLENK